MAGEAVEPPVVGWEELRDSPGLLQAGDLVHMQERGPLAWLVRYVTGRQWGKLSWASHSALVVSASPTEIVVESRALVTVRPLAAYRSTGARLLVHRKPGGLTAGEQRAVAEAGLAYEGSVYGGLAALAIALDHILGNRYLFRRLIRREQHPVCSGLVARVYHDQLQVEFGPSPDAVTPNDLLGYCARHGWPLVWADREETAAQYERTIARRR